MNRKTIVITGSTQGIGNGLALQFLKKGHQVLINGRRVELLNRRVDELQAMGYEVVGVAGDVREEATFQKVIKKAQMRFGRIDIWINNAGIPQPQQFFIELSTAEIEASLDVNILGVMLGTRAALQFFVKQGHGKLFNMEGFGSDGRIMEKLSLYGTTKRAVNYFTKSVSNEVKEKSIQVGILSPGMVRTDFIRISKDMDEADRIRNKRVFDILAEEVDVVTAFLAARILKSRKQGDQIKHRQLAGQLDCN